MSTEEKTTRGLTGSVVSNKMDKTISVRVQRTVKHPLYEKFIRRSTKVLAHDENNECNEGDVVVIKPSKPLSKNKSWKLDKIVTRSQ
jgi:small subunit ribosomal protein S17